MTPEKEFLSEEDLQEIEARCEAATAGPWDACLDVFDPDGAIEACVSNDATRHADMMLFTSETAFHTSGANCPEWKQAAGSQEMIDAQFIAHSRADVPRLIAEIRRLRSTVDTPTTTETEK